MKKKERPKKSSALLTTVYIYSKGLETIFENDTHYVTGSLNGVAFKVPCDQATEVPPAVAEVLRGIIQKQRSQSFDVNELH